MMAQRENVERDKKFNVKIKTLKEKKNGHQVKKMEENIC